ncbi:hypothetical protein KVQ01_11460 [Escherichia coli]|uniref:hypothetical protein n=1 Tax=Escherichia coli TaxID=562 RepID=UPI001F05E231|nr:hypothetical protein [Escherichia coli]MCH0685637.1 hypothetical protein [Escherichia coli]MDZ8664460.1 hypothetical protein [Escherichia coli]WRX87720.1 hypothetical protein SM938_22600 [Escherichia coli]
MSKPTYEELEAQVKQLAAENAALKSSHPQPFGPEMMKAIEAYELHQDDVPETGMMNAFFILRDSITLNNGVTDSVIAKIRAESMADGAFGALKLMGGFTSDECGDSVYLTVKGYAEQLSNSVHNPGSFLASLRAEGHAEGVDMAIQHLHSKFEGTGNIGVPVMALEWLAAQLRSQSEQVKGVQS